MSSNKPHRLLAIRPGGIGDCILSFPALESLRGRCDYLEIWVPRPVVPLVRFADAVRAINSTGLDLVGLPHISSPQNLFANFDEIVTWYGTNRDEFRDATSHLNMEFHAALPPPDCQLHASEFFCKQLQTQPLNPKISITAARRDFVAIHPFSGSPKKNWPLENYLAVASELTRQASCSPPADFSLPLEIRFCASPEQNLAAAFETDSLGELAIFLAEARIYVGNDSGITHLAAAVGTPTIAIFQASDPRIWAPRGKRVTILEHPDTNTVVLTILKSHSK